MNAQLEDRFCPFNLRFVYENAQQILMKFGTKVHT